MTSSKKDIAALFIGKVLQVLIGLASIKILTGMLSEAEVGQYYLLLTILTLFNFAFLNPIGQYYGRHVIGWQQNNKLGTGTFMLAALRALAIVISVPVVYSIYLCFGYDEYYKTAEFIIFITVSLLAGSYLVFLNALNTLGRRVLFIKLLVVTLSVGLISSILISRFVLTNGMGWLYGVALSQALMLVPTYRILIKNSQISLTSIRKKLNYGYIKKIAIFIAPITLTLFLQWGQNTAYRFIIEDKYKIEVLAYIAVGFSVSGAIFSAVESLTTQYFNPIYFKSITNAAHNVRAESWSELASKVIPIYLSLTIFVITLSPSLIQILVAEKFHDAYMFVALGAMVEFFRVSSNLVYLVSQSEVNTKKTIMPYVVGLTFTVTSLCYFDFSENLWFIPATLAFSYSLIFIFMFFQMRKILSVQIKMKYVIGSLLASLPFLTFLLLERTSSLLASFSSVLIGGIYFMLIVYLVVNQKSKVLVS